MTPQEIIIADSKERGLDANQIMGILQDEIGQGKGFILHQDNSLLYCRIIAPGVAEMHLFTEDSPLALLHALQYFIEQLRSKGIRTVTGNADNPGIIRFLEKAGLQIEQATDPRHNWKAQL